MWVMEIYCCSCGGFLTGSLAINPTESKRVAQGMNPELVRLTLARKIAAITLTLWKKGERFNDVQVKAQAA
jgi:hypothetical protein